MEEGLTVSEHDQLVETAMTLMYDLTGDNIVHLYTGGLENFVEVETTTLLRLSLDVDVDEAVSEAGRHLAEGLLIPRQSPCPATVPRCAQTATQEHIMYLRAQPQQTQGSLEWHEFRHKHLTASNIWKALGSDANVAALTREKCAPGDLKRRMSVSLDTTLHWGHKYEPVSLALYEEMYSTTVSEFGCIQSPMRDYLAASPDGINTDTSSDRYGRMVEVKNIVNREITGVPKPEYWVQMQAQMAACQLEYCDFVETRFVEITYAQFVQKSLEAQKPVGYMALFLTGAGQPVYEYGAPTSNRRYDDWNAQIMRQHTDKQWLKNVFWELDEISIVEVRFNKRWFDAALPFFDRCWTSIQIKRETGEHLSSPRKRRKTVQEIPASAGELKCLIDIA